LEAVMLPDAVVPVAETTRSGVVESIHFGAVVALDTDGMTLWSAGDPDTDVYPRSALKPLQAQAMSDAGFAAESDELAVAAASHSGEPMHLEVVLRILDRAGLDEGALRNTPALPLGTAAAADVLRAGGSARPLLQNCSGKHAAMLATSVANGWDVDSYLELDHPVQKLIDTYIAEEAGGVSHTGIDGCGAPTAMITLTGLAFAVRSLAIRQSTVYAAMRAHPELVAGERREDTLLMRAVPGLIAKGGAEGIHVAAHPDGRAVAVKVADGSERARVPVMVAALRSLGFDVDDVPVPLILGHGRPVGEVRSLVGRPRD
jgi:L-asparaginase II